MNAMESNISGFCIIIRTVPEKSSKFSRMKNFLRDKIAKLMYSVRKYASGIVINGKRVVAEPDDLPRELRTLSVKQLKKIKKILTALNPDVDGPEKTIVRLWNSGIYAPRVTPPVELDDDNTDVEISYEYEHSACGKTTPQSPSIASDKATTQSDSVSELSVISTSTNDIVIEDIDECSSPAESIEEIPYETKRLMRMNRPYAAKGERYNTVIPPYIDVGDDCDISFMSRRKKRPAAAKGERKRPVVSSDLYNLPAEDLDQYFKGTASESRLNTGLRQHVPRDNVHSAMEERLFNLPGAVDSNEVCGKSHDDDNDLLDELCVDLGINLPVKSKHRVETPVSRGNATYCDFEESDDTDDDIYNVPYLPKSQRLTYIGKGLTLPWIQ